MVSQYLVPFYVKKKIKFWLASLTTMTNSENHSSNPFYKACSGFQVAACNPTNCFNSCLWFWKLFMICSLEKINQWQRRKAGNKIRMRLLEQLFDWVIICKEATTNFILISSFTSQLKILKPSAHVQKVLIKFHNFFVKPSTKLQLTSRKKEEVIEVHTVMYVTCFLR